MINKNIPPCGVIDKLLCDVEFDPVERYRFWLLLLHTMWRGSEVVEKIVRVQATPDPLAFDAVAVGELVP